MQKHTVFLLSACCISGILITNQTFANEENIYNVKDVSCKKNNAITFCTDKSGTPISGEMLKYKKGVIIRRYKMKDGYLHGTGEAYDNNGYITATYPYEKGKLNGMMQTVNRFGKITSEVPYIDGMKEGVTTFTDEKTTSKAIYIADRLNGDWYIWDNKTKRKIYENKLVQDNLVSAAYYHYDENDKNCCKPSIQTDCKAEPDAPCCASLPLVKETMPQIIIDGFNQGCLDLQKELSCVREPVKAKGSSNECNLEWRLAHRQEVINYFKNFKK